MSDLNDTLQSVMDAFRRYYNVTDSDVLPPFSAYAEFKSHNEQYYLVKAAKIADIDSNEYVYFAVEDRLSLQRLDELSETAWEDGLKKVVPSYGHRNSDITLIIISNHIDQNAFSAVKRKRLYKSYKHTFYGWSHFKLVAMDLSLKRLTYNRQGQVLKKVLNNKL